MIRKANFFAAPPIDKQSSIITYGHKHPLTNHILATFAASIPPKGSVLALYPRSSIIVLAVSRQTQLLFFLNSRFTNNTSPRARTRDPPPPMLCCPALPSVAQLALARVYRARRARIYAWARVKRAHARVYSSCRRSFLSFFCVSGGNHCGLCLAYDHAKRLAVGMAVAYGDGPCFPFSSLLR